MDRTRGGRDEDCCSEPEPEPGPEVLRLRLRCADEAAARALRKTGCVVASKPGGTSDEIDPSLPLVSSLSLVSIAAHVFAFSICPRPYPNLSIND